ncbi:uncharacterized protein LOC129291582 isoform X2 [Prosopis cineraria]|uniref:uncharacterized protein LOC129291582 isoform X2 n=1 Tax=Prosopis cineraria TaxID=364024 RepID=UPI0024100E71|nr:uncharacterized protein LOC129291582 isoform X2 [Prosopis cineraria]
MESQVRHGFVAEYLYSLQKCEEMLVLWDKEMAELECHFNLREKHSKSKKLKVASSSSKTRMVIGTSEAFMNASECVPCIADTKSRPREMYRIKDCRSKNMLKRVFPVGELEQLNQRLKMLEEDMENMKQAILRQVKEKRRLVNRIYHYFQCMQYMLWHRSEVKGEQLYQKRSIIKTPKFITQGEM